MKRRSLSSVSFFCLAFLAACGSIEPSAKQIDPAAQAPLNLATPDEEPDPDIDGLTKPREIMKAVFDEGVRHQPTNAIWAGVRTFDAQMDDLSSREFVTYYRRMRKLAAKLGTIDPTKVTPGEQVALDIAKTASRRALSGEKASVEQWEVGPFDTVGNQWAGVVSAQTLRSRADVDALITRLRRIPVALRQHMANLRRGIDRGLTASRPVIEQTIPNYRGYLGLTAAEGSPFASVRFAEGVSESDKQAWKADVVPVVDTLVRPVMLEYADFMQNTLVPRARTTYGVGGLGDLGRVYYPEQIEVHLGRAFTPTEVHDLGLRRVAEIEPLMRRDLESLGINEPTLAAGLLKLKDLPESKAATVEEVRAHAQALLPRLYANEWSAAVWGVPNPPPMNVNVIAGDGSAFYFIGSNTMTLRAKSKPLYQFDSDVVHESMHYLQDLVIRSASGEEPVSPYVSTSGGSAMSEGSAHYAEVLALDTTIYDRGNARLTALTRLAALSDLMLRGVRLVVDTGIHAKGWTREQTIAYMTERLDMTAGAIAFEADRYASWPGQALTYRLGSETIASEQARARAALGDRFSQSAYNRMVLSLFGGSVDLLKQKTDAFIASPP